MSIIFKFQFGKWISLSSHSYLLFQIPVCIILFQWNWGPSKTLQATLEWIAGDLIIVQLEGARTDCGSHTISSSSDPLYRSHCSQRRLVFPGLQYIALYLIPGLGSEGAIIITGLVWHMAKQKWLQFMVWFCWRGLFSQILNHQLPFTIPHPDYTAHSPHPSCVIKDYSGASLLETS